MTHLEKLITKHANKSEAYAAYAKYVSRCMQADGWTRAALVAAAGVGTDTLTSILAGMRCYNSTAAKVEAALAGNSVRTLQTALPQALRTYRRENRMSQRELAEKIGLSSTSGQTYISRAEGSLPIPARVHEQIVKAMETLTAAPTANARELQLELEAKFDDSEREATDAELDKVARVLDPKVTSAAVTSRAKVIESFQSDSSAKERCLVWLASPYAGDVEENKTYAGLCAMDSAERGEAPFVPHLLYTQFLNDEKAADRQLGMELGQAWMSAAEKLAVYCDRGISAGMKKDIKAAYALGLEVDLRFIFE